ncbi:hypothetical protein NC651_017980 [Populus alba x Populus x berolinensis]|nr:hypothetical protein NC651_017980 [Populus alba x Populus x berolinensis]
MQELTIIKTTMVETKNQKHFVVVHGACHGAWCWQKFKTLLESASNRVTLLDLAASGANTKAIQDVETLDEYTEPLLEFLASLQPKEKVILVGHSLGGLSLALAMEKFPEKIAVAVFLSAFMPDTTHKPSFVLDQDLEQAKTMVRPGSLFLYDLSKANSFSTTGYGSVKRVYVMCNEDLAIPVEFQRWMIENGAVEEVMEIEWEISGWTLLMTNLILEIASAVFDQMGYALIGMVLAFVALLLAAVELIMHMALKERIKWAGMRPILPLIPATRKPVGTIVEYFGLAGAAWQCVYSTVEYTYTRQEKDNPIKMCLLPFIFLLCVVISKLLVDKRCIDESSWQN